MAKDEASRRVFYSWQSDLPNNTNRTLIEKALEQAIKSLAKSGAVELAEVDRDTRGVAGAPNITTTIFDKIAGATAFVADISTVNPEPRATPNPNVLVELGSERVNEFETVVGGILCSVRAGKPEFGGGCSVVAARWWLLGGGCSVVAAR